MKKFILPLVLLFFLFFSLSVTIFYISKRTNLLGRAAGPSSQRGEAELENSYLFASPLQARADGKEKIRITVFILDSQGLGVADKSIFLGQNPNLAIEAIGAQTDSLGRAVFDVSSFSPGDYFLEARIGNQVLPQRVKISFR